MGKSHPSHSPFDRTVRRPNVLGLGHSKDSWVIGFEVKAHCLLYFLLTGYNTLQAF